MMINDPDVVSEVTEAFARYEKALGENEVAVLDELFWDAPETWRLGVGENLYGYEAIVDFRRARPGGSPERTLVRTTITTFGRDFATTAAEFRRTGQARIGRQTQTWVRTEAGWRIVSAHVSLMGDSH